MELNVILSFWNKLTWKKIPVSLENSFCCPTILIREKKGYKSNDSRIFFWDAKKRHSRSNRNKITKNKAHSTKLLVNFQKLQF